MFIKRRTVINVAFSSEIGMSAAPSEDGVSRDFQPLSRPSETPVSLRQQYYDESPDYVGAINEVVKAKKDLEAIWRFLLREPDRFLSPEEYKELHLREYVQRKHHLDVSYGLLSKRYDELICIADGRSNRGIFSWQNYRNEQKAKGGV